MQIIKNFFDYAEIKTKVTSVFPFFMTLGYLWINHRQIRVLPTLLFFFGMFLFDLTATTINNYADTKKSGKALPFARPKALVITFVLFFLSAALGLSLVVITDYFVLLLGAVCFLFGVTYSWGPIPISHGPYGEVVSGFFYGFLIPLILIYINDPSYLLTFSVSLEKIAFELNTRPLFGLVLLAVLPFCLTANIMLANNTCDVEHDVKVRRFTLPFYLKRYSLYLFAFFYYAAYASVIAMVVFGYLSPLSLLLLVTLIPVQKNINLFWKRQVKEETFIVSVKNFLLIITVHIALIFLSMLLPGWGAR